MNKKQSTIAMLFAVFLLIAIRNFSTFFIFAPQAQSLPDSVIAEMISKIDESEIYSAVYQLQNFTSREYYNPGNEQASTYLYDEFRKIPRLSVEYQGVWLRNVIATLNGTDPTSNAIFMVGAHYDSASNVTGNAPGATDNGGGVAIVLEFARIMSMYNFKHTLKFACWNREEDGLIGSRAYVEYALSNSLNISLYINFDSSCYDPDNRFVLDIMYNSNSTWVSEMMTQYNTLYNIDFTLKYNVHDCNSDHKPFWLNGFTAIMTHSETHGPAHTIYDTVDKVSTLYAKKNGQLGMSVLAKLAEVDAKPPTISILSPENKTYSTHDVSLTFTIDEAANWICYGLDEQANQSITENTTLLGLSDGLHTLTVYANDTNGNMGASSMVYFTVDTTPPKGSIVIADGLAYTNSTSVTLTLSADDATSGIAQMSFSNDNIDWTLWEPYSTFRAWALTLGDGAKTVFVQFMDNAGLVSQSYQDTIILDTKKPTANAGDDQTINEDTLITLDASASQDENDIASYIWTFTDVTLQTLTGKNPTYTFATPGTYTITLKATDPAGNSATDIVIFTVLDITKPIVDAGLNQTVNEDTLVTFDGSASSDNMGIISYTWAFMDVGTLQTLDGMKPVYTFQTPATYMVTLEVTDAAGNSATDVVTIVVLDVTKPIANAGLDQTENEDTLVTFDASGSSDNVGCVSYTWTFTDITTITLSGKNPTYTFATPGIYVVTLKVADQADNYATDTATITILDVTAPVANAGLNRTISEDSPITLDGSASSDNVGITTYTWIFADVTTKTLIGQKPTYTFNTPGVYTITLNVTDVAGNWATDTTIVSVLDVTGPVANAAPRDQTINAGEPVNFDASGSTDNVGIVSYEWDFGDGTTETGKTTTHTYTYPRTYSVTLTVKDAAGNTATDTITITVRSVAPPPPSPPPPAQAFPMWILGGAVATIAIMVTIVILWRKMK